MESSMALDFWMEYFISDILTSPERFVLILKSEKPYRSLFSAAGFDGNDTVWRKSKSATKEENTTAREDSEKGRPSSSLGRADWQPWWEDSSLWGTRVGTRAERWGDGQLQMPFDNNCGLRKVLEMCEEQKVWHSVQLLITSDCCQNGLLQGPQTCCELSPGFALTIPMPDTSVSCVLPCQPGILMQREDVILEWIFLPYKPNKKLKTYIEKISDLIHKDTHPSSKDQKQRHKELEAMPDDEVVPGEAMMPSAAGHKTGSAGSEGLAEQQ
ncbi:hypothetical protein STEG23_014454 [Scotinomys teguina]